MNFICIFRELLVQGKRSKKIKHNRSVAMKEYGFPFEWAVFRGLKSEVIDPRNRISSNRNAEIGDIFKYSCSNIYLRY